MKSLPIIICLVCLCLSLQAAVTATFSPREIQLNQLKTFTFDPADPESQPSLTQLTITNQAEPTHIKMQVVLRWNNSVIIQPNQAVFISREPLATGANLVLSNRDLIREQGSVYFEPEGNISIDIIDVIENYPTLEEAVLSGYYPDGRIFMEVSVKAADAQSWDSTATFTINIRNTGAIYLTSPGKAIGQVPPTIDTAPVSFLWNAINTGFNTQSIVIKEFPPHMEPDLSTVAQTGTVIYRTPEGTNVSSGFSEYIPFNDGYYYAWRVYTQLYTETNYLELDKSNSGTNFVASDWFVFQYQVNEPDPVGSEALQSMLNALGNSQLLNLQNLGFTPTGEVIYEGRVYRGQEAIDIISSLIGKDIQVEIKD
ncbi:MAG: hypothetical protein PWP64_467 [Candidatus Cloacimonadota bacterium]|nr:hypothetical protein [Candidatus Cloacimonadota bacterium]